MSSSSDPDEPDIPTFQHHLYPHRSASLKVAGRPDDVFVPGCCGHVGGAGASGSAAGAVLEARYSEGRVFLGEGCDIVLDGWQPLGKVCEVKGVFPMRARKYRCRTHKGAFTHFSPGFAGWLYSQQGPGGCSMWDFVRPEPLLVKHGRTYMSQELLASLVIQYENGMEVYGLRNSMQDMWLAQDCANESEYAFHTGDHFGPVPWWEVGSQGKVLSDRRKLTDVLAAYFEHFLSHAFERDMLLAQQRLARGVSTDETFKLSKRCSVWKQKDPIPAGQPGDAAAVAVAAIRKGKYEDATFCLHTLYSLVTQMVVGLAFLPDKSNRAKELLFERLFTAQAAAPDAVFTGYVGSDNPHNDLGMLLSVQERVLPQAAPLHVGDDLWHVMDRLLRHRRSVAYGGVRKSLLGVLKRGVRRAEEGVPRTPVPMPSSTLVLPAFRFGALHELCQSGEDGCWRMCRPPGSVGQATQAAKNGKLPEAVRRLCADLFQRHIGIPFEAVAARCGVPYIITYKRSQRVYTMADFAAEFELHGGLVL